MTISLENYTNGARIVSLAKSRETLRRCLLNGLNAVFIYKERALLYPDEIALDAKSQDVEKLAALHDFDVLEITENGRVFQLYDVASNDNALVVSGKCNSNCVMCPYSESYRRDASTAPLEKLLAQVKHIPSDATFLTITGGEPFLLGRDMFRLLQALRDKFETTRFQLLTNGRVFALPEYCRLYQKTAPTNTTLRIPLYGATAVEHDAITQTPGSFDETFAGLKNLARLNIAIELRVVVSKLNAERLSAIADFISTELPSQHVKSVKFMGLEMLGAAAKNRERVWLPYEEAFEQSKGAIAKLMLNGFDVELYNFPLCAVERAFWPICAKSVASYKARFSEKCSSCRVQDACGGIFAGSFRQAAVDVKPVEK